MRLDANQAKRAHRLPFSPRETARKHQQQPRKTYRSISQHLHRRLTHIVHRRFSLDRDADALGRVGVAYIALGVEHRKVRRSHIANVNTIRKHLVWEIGIVVDWFEGWHKDYSEAWLERKAARLARHRADLDVVQRVGRANSRRRIKNANLNPMCHILSFAVQLGHAAARANLMAGGVIGDVRRRQRPPKHTLARPQVSLAAPRTPTSLW